MDFTSLVNGVTTGVVRRLFGDEASTPLRMLTKQKHRLEAQEAGRQVADAQSPSTDGQDQASEDTHDPGDVGSSGADIPEPPDADGFWSQIFGS